MKQSRIRLLLSAGVLALSLHQSAVSATEFIDNMPELQPDQDRPGAMKWGKPGVNASDYKMVMLEPITIFISPDSEYKGISPDELAVIAQKFTEAITQVMEPEIPVVNKSGAGVLYLRAALVNVDLAKKKRGLLGYTPIGFVAGAVKEAAAGPSLSLKHAQLEVEGFDPVSNERVGVLIDKAPTDDGGEMSWESIDKTLLFYAQRLKSRMLSPQKPN